MSLGDAINEYLNQSGLGLRRKSIPAIDAWNAAVGPEMAAIAQAVSYRRGELIIEVQDSTLLSELRGFAAEDLRTRADALLEGARIRKLTFKLKPLR